jgi:uncharacterized BrkB/YihY/UPF0761 family membrane protein
MHIDILSDIVKNEWFKALNTIFEKRPLKLHDTFCDSVDRLLSLLLIIGCGFLLTASLLLNVIGDVLTGKLQHMKYLKNIKQLTFGGNNAEAYWSFDDSKLVFQSDLV